MTKFQNFITLMSYILISYPRFLRKAQSLNGNVCVEIVCNNFAQISEEILKTGVSVPLHHLIKHYCHRADFQVPYASQTMLLHLLPCQIL